MSYRSGSHTLFHHRFHIVWAPKYRYKVLIGDVRLRVRDVVRQVCAEMGVTIINGVLSKDHVHLFVEIPPHISVSQFVQKAKGRSSRRIQQEFEYIRKRYWGQRFWARGYFSTTSGNITDDVITAYLERHTMPPDQASA
ncbi:MAG: IS200/IS605 family transposase [Sphingomonadales bacterium]|nr:IS200/IS605 family transposase [Sphingomonadales bacterium]